MEGVPKIVGPGKEHEKKQARERLARYRDEALKPVEGEIEKTDDDRMMIEAINEIIEKKLNGYELKYDVPIDEHQIHLFRGDIIRDPNGRINPGLPKTTEVAYANPLAGVIVMNSDFFINKAMKFCLLLHECIHIASYTSAHLDAERNLRQYRSGYHTKSVKRGIDSLAGFDELVTEVTAHRLMREYGQLLNERFDITQKDIDSVEHPYYAYVPIAKRIVEKIARLNGKTSNELIDTWIRGKFTGEMMHLRSVERAFGRNSLQIFSGLHEMWSSENNEELRRMTLEYFSESDDARRRELEEPIMRFIGAHRRKTSGQIRSSDEI